MGYYILQAGTSLQKCSTGGTLTNISLPGSVTVSSTIPVRAALLANTVVITNGTSVNIAMNPSTLATRVLSIAGPSAALSSSAGASGVLSGIYRWAYTYAIVSGTTVLTESPLSPASTPLTLSSQQGSLSGITTSGTSGVNCRIIYQTTNSGTDYYEVTRINDNSTTTATVNTSDYDLALLPVAEDKGNPPGVDGTDRLRLIVSWKDRLFASPNVNKDYIYYSGNREIYSWSAADFFTAKPAGEDDYGVTAFLPRRNELVVGKKRRILKIIGNDPTDFELLQVTEAVGIVSQDASVVIRDECYFLGQDGFYRYGNAGLENLSRDKVHPWFATDSYFNRALFNSAVAIYNPTYDEIHLYLSAVGTSTINRWVRYNLATGQWFGPDLTGAFTITAAANVTDANNFTIPVVASSAGYVYTLNRAAHTDDTTAITLDIITDFYSGDDPDSEKAWLQPTIFHKKESAGQLMFTAYVGDLSAPASPVQSVDLTSDRSLLQRLGTGRFCKLQFTNSENLQGTTLYGYLLPWKRIGRR